MMLATAAFLAVLARPSAPLSPAVTAAAPVIPIETNADRKPTLVTNGNVLIRGGRILTATRGTIESGDILVQNGKIVAIGANLTAPAGVAVFDARGKVVAPGIVDAHIHRGIDATNEGSDSITSECRIRDVLNPDAMSVWDAAASGQTSGLALHGSANPAGGESIVVKLKYGAPVDEYIVADAPRMVKFALGENVTRSGSATSTRFPRTRMGVEATYRRAFQDAKEYMAAWDAYEKSTDPNRIPPRKDLRLDALADILRGKIWVQCHSYRADEMLMMAKLSKEFGFKIGALQHALEAYKIAPELASLGVGVSMFVDNWSFKIEGYDAIPYNAWLSTRAGVDVSINTDGVSGTTAINIDAAKAMHYGGLTEEEALRTITINPARQLGIDHRTGSLEVGKDADIVVWDGHPLSVYAKPVLTMIEGDVYFQRRDAFGVDKDATLKTRLDAPVRREPRVLPLEVPGYAITGATVYPVSGPPIENATVVMMGDRITAVGERVPIPRGAHVVDGRGLRVYPGFIDGGTSIGLSEISPIGQMVDNRELGNFQPDLRALTGIWMQSEHIPVTRVGGITTVVSRPVGGIVAGQAAIVHLRGWTADEMNSGVEALYINFPDTPGAAFFDPSLSCCGLDDVLSLMGSDAAPLEFLQQLGVLPLLHDHSDGSEHSEDEEMAFAQPGGGQGGGGDASGRVRQLTEYFDRAVAYRKARESDATTKLDPQMEAMLPYLRGERPVMLSMRLTGAIRNAVAFGEKYGLRIILVGAADAWRVADFLAEKKIPVILSPAGNSTLSANNTVNEWDPYDTPYIVPMLLQRAGVKFAFQSNSNSLSCNLPFRVGMSCAYGLKPDDALRALTLSAAEILGIGDQVGSIEPGKRGNLIVTTGDPFELTSNHLYVFINGRPIEMTSKFTRLRDQWGSRILEPGRPAN